MPGHAATFSLFQPNLYQALLTRTGGPGVPPASRPSACNRKPGVGRRHHVEGSKPLHDAWKGSRGFKEAFHRAVPYRAQLTTFPPSAQGKTTMFHAFLRFPHRIHTLFMPFHIFPFLCHNLESRPCRSPAQILTVQIFFFPV